MQNIKETLKSNRCFQFNTTDSSDIWQIKHVLTYIEQ